jgi:mannosyltransferase OCH1-like enzyme
VLIPRVFHQIWVGPQPFPAELARYQQTWLNHHPGWELRLWTEESLPHDLDHPEGLERLRQPNERSNFLRYELLWRFGGVYLDTDFECLRSIEPLIAETKLFVGCSKPGRPHDALLGSVARHPALNSVVDTLVARQFYGQKGQGSRVQLRSVLDDHRDEVLFLEPTILFPTKHQMHDAYAVHHHLQSWKTSNAEIKRARRSARRWRDRYREAAGDAEGWRVRYEEAQAELDRLHQPSGAAGGSSARPTPRRSRM